jgi:hypothetical protein
VENVEYPSNTNGNVGDHTVMSPRAISCVSVELVCDVPESVLEFTELINSTDIPWRIDPLLSGDYKQRSFLGNGSVNTFPGHRIRPEQEGYCWKRCVFYMVRAEIL